METSLRTTEINLPDPQSVKEPLSHLINTIPGSSPGPPRADAKALINADRPECAGSPGRSGLCQSVQLSVFLSGAGSGSNRPGGEFSEAAEQTGGPSPAQPSKAAALTPGSCQAELTCDYLDVNAIKTNVLPGTGVLCDLLLGRLHLGAEPRRRSQEWLSPEKDAFL